MNRQILLGILSILFTGFLFGSGIYGLINWDRTIMTWLWAIGTGIAFGTNFFLVWRR